VGTLIPLIIPTKAVLSGKLAAAVKRALPGHAPLAITCTGEGLETRCTVPTNGPAAASTFANVPLPKKRALEIIKLFFPEG
jgi:hypothetical protein